MSKKASRRGHKTAKKQSTPAVVNRRAGFDYDLGDTLVVGLELTGGETKAARLGHVQLKGAYVTTRLSDTTKQAELYLINASFSLATNAPKGQPANAIDTRARKILAKRREIEQLVAEKQQGMTIVPTKLLTNGRFIKLVIALGKGKKRYDKRETIRRKDLARENQKFTKTLR
jgi:SsrA-binding protein